MKETLDQRTQGFVNCVFQPSDFLTHPSRYSTEEETYQRLDVVLKRIISSFPKEYKEGFKLKCQYKDLKIIEDPDKKVEGRAFYMNAEIFDNENPHHMWVSTETLGKIRVYEREQIPRRLLSSFYNFHAGAFFIGFNFQDKESASQLFQAFEKRSFIRGNDNTKEPHIRIQDKAQEITIYEGISAVRYLSGIGKIGKMVACKKIKGMKYTFQSTYST